MAKLYIVGTPIGNLEDITLRALKILKKVDIIACEDTRVTRKLLNHYEINNKKLIVHNKMNEKKSTKGIIDLLNNDKNVAIVSDAGMPTINDPGFIIIQSAKNNDINIEVIPGPSAITTAITIANFGSFFTFHGFFKYKTIQRQNQLKKLNKGVHIFFGSPHRIIKEIQDIENICGKNTKIFIGRELTKKFETHYWGNPKELLSKINNIKGEITIIIKLNKEK